MASYSAFFSSGLLAPQLVYKPSTMDSDTIFNDYYDSPPSPLPAFDDVSDVEMERSITPTSSSPMLASSSQTTAFPTTSTSQAAPVQAAMPRTRKRRSSLTVATSPVINSIKSPTRSAGTALQFQRFLQASPSRTRSGSVGGESFNNTATEQTSLMGRMRSGSVGTVLRPRRALRRIPVPAAAPPPTAPLPALPAFPVSAHEIKSHLFPGKLELPMMPHSGPRSAPLFGQMSPTERSPLAQCAPGQTRGFPGLYQRGAGRIDEEMKEN